MNINLDKLKEAGFYVEQDGPHITINGDITQRMEKAYVSMNATLMASGLSESDATQLMEEFMSRAQARQIMNLCL